MARGDYSPEIKSAMQSKGKKYPPDTAAEKKKEGDTPQELARDKQRGIVEGSPRDERIDVQAMQPAQPQQSSGHAPPHHVAAAAGIAHAILQGSPPPRSGY